MTREKGIILAARLISMAFTPFYLPTVGLVALFMFSYMSQMPWSYKFQLLTMVYLLTVVVPSVLIHFYRRHQGWSLIDLGQKERRAVPYVISILCYFLCIYLMVDVWSSCPAVWSGQVAAMKAREPDSSTLGRSR